MVLCTQIRCCGTGGLDLNHPLVINGVELKPLLTHHQAQDQLFVHGKDEKGPYVACQLHNHWQSPFYRWYVFVSPEDLLLMQTYRWYGNICGKNEQQGIEIRRREIIDSKQYSVQLRREIWERMGMSEVQRLQLLGHPLDFRRENISISVLRTGRRKPLSRNCRGITWCRNRWQVQIQLKGHSLYLGRVKDPIDGYRMYNRYLRALKSEYPEDQALQSAPYNDIDPQF